MSKSIDEFREILNNYDQQIIQPVIDDILANFEQDLSKFQASEEAWTKLAALHNHIKENLEISDDALRYRRIDYERHYDYKKFLSNLLAKCKLLICFKNNDLELKPVHFIFAFVHDTQKIEQLISKYNLNINDKTNNGSQAIHFAAETGNNKAIDLLINNYKINVSTKNSSGRDILFYLVINDHTEIFEIILSNHHDKFDIDEYNVNGRTLLHYAASKGNKHIARLLLEKYEANVNLRINESYSTDDALYIALRQDHYDMAKYLLEYGTNITTVTDFKNLFDEAICKISHSFKKFVSSDKSAEFRNHGIFNNSENIIGFIKNWPKFDWSYKKYSVNNLRQPSNILEVNEEKIIAAQHLIKSIMQFFHNRQQGLERLLAKGKLEKCKADNSDGNDIMYKVTKNFCKREIDWQKLESNLFYKYVLHNIMSGEIALHDENTDSNDIINELGIFAKIFLFHQAKFLNQNLQYQGELIDEISADTLTFKRTFKKFNFDYNLYQINIKNYQAMKLWEKERFFEIIGLKKRGCDLKIYTKQNTTENNEKEFDEEASMVWGSGNLLTIIASFYNVEQYYKYIEMNEVKSVENAETAVKNDPNTFLVGESNNETDLT